MPASAPSKAARLLLRVAAAYLLVFGLWLIGSRQYHLLLGRAAGVLVPLIVDSHVDRIWDDGDDIRYEVTFHRRDAGRRLSTREEVTSNTRINMLHFGYPMITFLALAIGLPWPGWRKRIVLTAIGAALLMTVYALWVLIRIYQSLGEYDVPFLQHNVIISLLPRDFYMRHEHPLLVFMGQVLPISVYLLVFFRSLPFGRRPASEGPASRRARTK